MRSHSAGFDGMLEVCNSVSSFYQPYPCRTNQDVFVFTGPTYISYSEFSNRTGVSSFEFGAEGFAASCNNGGGL